MDVIGQMFEHARKLGLAFARWNSPPLPSRSRPRCCGTSRSSTTSAGTTRGSRHEAPAPIDQEAQPAAAGLARAKAQTVMIS